MAKAKPKAKAEKKLEIRNVVQTFKIPARYEWGETLADIATGYTDEQIAKKATDQTLNAAVLGENFVAVQNENCDEVFIIHKDVLKELVEAVA